MQGMASPDPTRVDRFLAVPHVALSVLRSALTATRTPRDAAWALAEQAGIALGLLDCVVYLLEHDGRTLQQYAAWGHKQVAPRIFEHPIRLQIGEGIVGACATSRAPVYVPDTLLDPRYVVDDAPRRSELAVPIVCRGRLLGVLDSEHPEADAYRSAHVRGLLLLAETAADRLAALVGEPSA